MKKLFSGSLRRKLAFTVGLSLVLAIGTFTVTQLSPHVFARQMECNTNSVMNCGFSSKSDFIAQIKNGDSRGHKDLAGLYAAFGFTSSDYDRFVSSAKPALFYKDGRVVVDGKTVATEAFSYGRWQSTHTGPDMKTVSGGGTTIYGNYTTQTFVGYSYMTGYVLFDSTGTPEFMVVDSCGNPITAKVVKSSAVCDALSYTVVSGKLNTYDFTSKGSTSGLASITKYVYDFGDGSSTVTKSSGSSTVNHKYTKEGTFTAKVTVYASAPGSTTITSSTTGCQKDITVKLPYYLCGQLGGEILDQKTYSYRFTATIEYGNGAQFISADFDFGDGETKTGVKSTDGATVSTEHSYVKAGNYSASAVLRFTVDGETVTAPTCLAVVTPTKPPVPQCKPGIPVGDIRCTPCKYDASIPADDRRCEAPVTELPNTGAGNVIAISTIALVGGFLGYRHILFRKHKRAYNAADSGASPLPLADALNDEKPLAGTPVEPEPVRSSFRKRRQF